jgi:hypothetical protein
MSTNPKAAALGCLFFILIQPLLSVGQTGDTTLMLVNKVADFDITGAGDEPAWASASWVPLPFRRSGGTSYGTKMKILYSDSGIYCQYLCEDSLLTSTLREDFSDLYNEDVVEAFFWPDETIPIYFEYELSPYNYELPILVPNLKGNFLGWRPWHYEGSRKTRHATLVNKKGNRVISWTAEFFIPFQLLRPLSNVPPTKNTRWKANFYRIDYDEKPTAAWSWQLTRRNFHDYERFGTLVFN